ncbi:uncharacterized protein BT62DRAFT_419218 [Guyanagaster necrorhizus]|uniref:Uncharacterized protein n=1 Tax=Guyanagaster necrorhizus TaxID=856835 RepID=A0A9P7W2G4_9AGAR|nr:uncharacterized protein BT62DRAFT_419218 [Guyanagaster necrorhizus MCA 3950]KAG7451359.1 hypothetical protein BT62DRAFT_419218 [Guyanagaster necrorhizus MCA 3950]
MYMFILRWVSLWAERYVDPSKISWDSVLSAQDYGADKTFTRPASPLSPTKITREKKNSAISTLGTMVSRTSKRVTTCCCSCHCAYTTSVRSFTLNPIFHII